MAVLAVDGTGFLKKERPDVGRCGPAAFSEAGSPHAAGPHHSGPQIKATLRTGRPVP
jgi:hypothetical protein